ncbi:ATP-binding protein [Flexivirga oryzae]|uniref:Sensor-like histidine kinase SenX3 n=1 Tax=Flexivirga oryzae TaxID=1794944 RepID=A0A839NDC3_9MICO|nr:signal transduction histidine kinase [Flexivirga oryzae]
MLGLPQLLLITGTTFAATALLTCGTLLTLHGSRRRSVSFRAVLVLCGALLSVIVSTIAVAAEMYLSDHDVLVLGWVIGISAVMSIAATWIVTGRSARASVAALIGDTRRVGAGDVVGPVATGWREFDDVSAELAETSQRLAAARAQIVELDAARQQFFAWISHDLRTPLAGMAAMAEALEAGTAPDPAVYLQALRSKVDTVARMVDDLFELSKLQSGTLELHREPVVLLDLVSDAVADVRLVAESRRVTVTQENVDGHLLWADPRELTRAIGNLLANSLRYAPDDSTILIRADTIGESQLVLSVIDQGVGVAAENLGRMFDVGWRADPSRSSGPANGTPGAGLGLAIVRGIVEAHGGSVRARHSAAGFHLDLLLPVADRG